MTTTTPPPDPDNLPTEESVETSETTETKVEREYPDRTRVEEPDESAADEVVGSEDDRDEAAHRDDREGESEDLD